MSYVAVRCLLFAVVFVALSSVGNSQRLHLDGRKVSPGTQCRNRGPFGGVCQVSDPAERCLNMKCADTESHDIPLPYEVGPALQGTWCGDKKVCIKGQCVDDPEPPRKPLVITDFQYGCEEPWLFEPIAPQ